MGEVVKIIRIRVDQHDNGLLCASSPDLPGMVIIHRDLKAIRDDIPNVIRLMLKRAGGRDVEILAAANSEKKPKLISDWVAIPREKRAATG